MSTLGVNPLTAAVVEQAALTREHAVFGAPGHGPLKVVFFWTHDPKLILALAVSFDFDGKKQLEKSEWNITVVPGSKTVSKGLRDGADSLNEPEKQHSRSLVGTALYVGQDRPETQYAAGATHNSEKEPVMVHLLKVE